MQARRGYTHARAVSVQPALRLAFCCWALRGTAAGHNRNKHPPPTGAGQHAGAAIKGDAAAAPVGARQCAVALRWVGSCRLATGLVCCRRTCTGTSAVYRRMQRTGRAPSCRFSASMPQACCCHTACSSQTAAGVRDTTGSTRQPRQPLSVTVYKAAAQCNSL